MRFSRVRAYLHDIVLPLRRQLRLLFLSQALLIETEGEGRSYNEAIGGMALPDTSSLSVKNFADNDELVF